LTTSPLFSSSDFIKHHCSSIQQNDHPCYHTFTGLVAYHDFPVGERWLLSSWSFVHLLASADYLNSTSREWIRNCRGTSAVRFYIFFSSFQTLANTDVLRIYDRSGSNVLPFREFSGSQLPPRMLINTDYLRLEFNRTGTAAANGFSVTIYPLKRPDTRMLNTTASEQFVELNSTEYVDTMIREWILDLRNTTVSAQMTLTFLSFATEVRCINKDSLIHSTCRLITITWSS
jgi:hypothetical protein